MAMVIAVVAAVAFVVVIAFAGSGRGGNGAAGGGAGGPSSAPSEAPSETPTEDPSAQPSAAPSDEPSDEPSSEPDPTPRPVPATPRPTLEPNPGSDGMPIKVDLEVENGADVYVDIVDGTGFLVGAQSGSPAEGVSVPPYTLVVENVGENTLKLTWSDFPIDNALALYIDEVDGKLRLLLVQPEPTGPTDAMGSDRELILSFSKAVSADEVEAFIQDGLDSPG
jgi:hypothetical protein